MPCDGLMDASHFDIWSPFQCIEYPSKHYTLSPRRQTKKKKPTYTFISSTSHVFPPARVVRVSESWVARFCKLLALHWIWIGSIRISNNIDSNTSTVAFTQCSIFLQHSWNIKMINHENMPIPGSWHFISFSFFPYHLKSLSGNLLRTLFIFCSNWVILFFPFNQRHFHCSVQDFTSVVLNSIKHTYASFFSNGIIPFQRKVW